MAGWGDCVRGRWGTLPTLAQLQAERRWAVCPAPSRAPDVAPRVGAWLPAQ